MSTITMPAKTPADFGQNILKSLDEGFTIFFQCQVCNVFSSHHNNGLFLFCPDCGEHYQFFRCDEFEPDDPSPDTLSEIDMPDGDMPI